MRDRVCVDSVAFARDASELRGTAATADLPRLHDSLFDQSGEIAYSVTGKVDKDGVASLRLDVAADLLMTCQRCLGPLRISLNSARNFVLVPPADDLGDPAEEHDEEERIHADDQLDVMGLVEDEAILCLPMVAVHKSGECAPPIAAGGESDSKSPFSSLAALKRQ